MLVFQKLCKRGRREGRSHIGDHIGNDPLQQISIPDFIPFHDVLKLDRVEQIVKILLGRRIRIAEVCEVGHTSGEQVLLETLLDGRIRRNRTVKLHELSKRKRIDHKLHISSAQISHKLTGQQLCIGAGDVDITVK